MLTRQANRFAQQQKPGALRAFFCILSDSLVLLVMTVVVPVMMAVQPHSIARNSQTAEQQHGESGK
ncbi:hypothetical protein GCM10011507_06670 [Edaphobacter acidisoli]|uniref:Uncharacterized protein n=1 Tax=Edaphobacter acidisoli TaxID=2040573 RepID=A0A916W175_9BACT|nr:hypothetical protein [Edaphobacter acidisoli]GGA57991.1 hypothetical protein GCM10011507_06670 [Edaphobacter acidisoli]